jgi:hypothetical protein
MRKIRTVVCVAVLHLGAWLSGCQLLKRQVKDGPRNAIVHVRTESGAGTGFFVEASGGRVFVATAFHVVSSGEQCTVEREVAADDRRAYVEAFPETTLAAFDEEADLALLEIKNLPADRIAVLRLADDIKQDAEITSWGFPESSVARNLGLTQKQGRVSNFVKLPVIDPTYERSIKEDAIDAIIVSSDLEPGFSGGPTIDGNGAVVGVNVLKDLAHRGQNACVQASILKQLVAKAAQPMNAPSAAEIGKLLGDVEANYLRLPVEQRYEVLPTDVVALSDLPILLRLARHLRTYLWSGAPGAKLSVLLSKMPGELLPTYFDKTTFSRVADCEKAESDGFAGLSNAGRASDCRAFEVRPLAWDFVSASLQWVGQPRAYTVGKVDEVSAERHIYRAQIGTSTSSHTFPVYVSTEASRLRLRVTDEEGKLYALSATSGARAEDLYGKWQVKESSAPGQARAVKTTSESLELGPALDGKLSASHMLVSVAKAPDGKDFACNSAAEVRDTIMQQFEGTLENGVLTTSPVRAMERTNKKDCPVACGYFCSTYSEDTTAVFKLVGPDLFMFRTTGQSPVQPQRFTKVE